MDDFELLQAYARRQTDEAFTTLTGRYLNLVYSAARRQTGDEQMAKDIAQAVFLTLARKAGSLTRETILAGWLLRTTRFAAANARRLEQRRQHYEQQAMHSSVHPNESETAWQRIAPLLDDALERLGHKDRDAVVLRFFEQQSLRQVAEKLGLSEDGAQKRVTRAIEKLRLFFVHHGRNVSAAVLASTLAAHSVQAAPDMLANSIVALIGSKSVSTGTVPSTLTYQTLNALSRARWQTLAVRLGSVAALLVLVLFVVVQTRRSAVPGPMASSPPSPPEPSRLRNEASVSPPPRAVAAAAADGKKMLRLHVVDAVSQTAVTNAQLTLVSVAETAQRRTNIFFSDARGVGEILYSPIAVRFWSQRIEIFRDGYVPKYISWSESQQDDMEDIPDEYIAKLERAVIIGGVVRDEQEMPVPGVRVVFSVTGPIASRARERLTMMGDYHTEVTGADGNWSCHHVPPRFGMIDYKLVHPEFQDKTYACDSPDSPAYIGVERLKPEDLLARRAVLRVKRGLIIAGKVTDENGQPVARAKVTQGFDFRRAERNAFTEADGSFRFGNGRPRELSLTVQAAGLAPIVTSFVVKASQENLQFALPAGQPLLGRVLDEEGRPIAGASIEAASPSTDSRTLFEWNGRTGARGQFSWESAPTRQEYSVSASGFESQRRVTLVADATEQVIQLKRKQSVAVRLVGRVLDAGTKSPLASARLQIWETTKEPGGGFSTFTTRAEDVDAEGQFRLKTSSSTLRYVLEAQADGYWPERLTNEVAGNGEVRLEISLRAAPLWAGVVLGPAGGPAAGATLAVCGPMEWAQMNQSGKLQLDAHNGPAGAVADLQGRFRLPSKHSPQVVLISHADGFAEVPFSKISSNTVITLEAWGRIEGTARMGTHLLAEQKIHLGGTTRRTPGSLGVALSLAATSDASGHFVFESVPSGEWKVDHELNPRPSAQVGIHFPVFSHGVPVEVRPGETANVVLGGHGRTVIGKATVPPAGSTIPWMENAVVLSLKNPGGGPPEPPLRARFGSEEAFASALQAFVEKTQAYWTSAAGRAWQRLQRQYAAMLGSDGTFRIEDVPPGEYLLKINLTEPPKPSRQPFMNSSPIATWEKEIIIPAVTDQQGDSDFNLGTLPLAPVALQRAGN